MKKILFLTGTRADYGKMKSLMRKIDNHNSFELHIFVTGMHLLSKYGATYKEIEKDGFTNVYKFVNQKLYQSMDLTLSNTISGFSNYISELNPDLIVVHGDRVEALAGAIVGALNNIKVAHIEGGEVSGTIDESIRHAITKFSHIHLVANEEAKNRVLQLGEKEKNVYVIGSPDIDIMYSANLPTITEAKNRYEIPFDNYSIFMFHPVTTELECLENDIKCTLEALIKSQRNYIIIYPNNDEGSLIILNEIKKVEGNVKFRVFPSIRFEYFLTLLKQCDIIIGNSSSGIREAGVYGIPSIDIGSRQHGRYDKLNSKHIIHVQNNLYEILDAMQLATTKKTNPISPYGDGKSDTHFISLLEQETIWESKYQKQFVNFGSEYKVNVNV